MAAGLIIAEAGRWKETSAGNSLLNGDGCFFRQFQKQLIGGFGETRTGRPSAQACPVKSLESLASINSAKRKLFVKKCTEFGTSQTSQQDERQRGKLERIINININNNNKDDYII